MKEQFLKWVGIREDFIKDNMQITYNSVGEEFTKNKYQKMHHYSFETIISPIQAMIYLYN